MNISVVAFLAVLALAITERSAYSQIPIDNLALYWDKVALQCVRNAKPGPPMAARALAITHTAIFDAWAVYDEVAVGVRPGGSPRRPAQERSMENKNKAVSFAAHDALLALFPSQRSYLALMLGSMGYDAADRSTGLETAAGIGHAAARAVIEFRLQDGSNQSNGYADTTGYQSVNTPAVIDDPTRWQPLQVPDGKGGFTVQKYLAPHWGTVKPFALEQGSQFRPVFKVPAADSPEYAEDVAVVTSYSALLTDHQKAVAEYWADGPGSETPPGHWCLLAQQVSHRNEHGLDRDVKMFFAVANAVFDAGIAAWDAKRAYDSVRPITAVHYLFKGKSIDSWGGPFNGMRRIAGENWQPYQAPTFVTPPFPEYLSGHSTFSAAAAEVLKRFQGSDFFPYSVTIKAGSSMFEPGVVPANDVVLTWSTFSEAADEAGMSRRYGGIHFVAADLDGRKLGRQVGSTVWEAVSGYVNGTIGR